MSRRDQIVYVVDDDGACRDGLVNLFNAWEYNAVAFDSAHDFIACAKPDRVSCIVLDLVMPGLTGLDLQKQLEGTSHPPIIFLTGRGNIPKAVQAMRAGAMEFLTKPFIEMDLINAVQNALEKDRMERAMRACIQELRVRLSRLTPRERDVLPLIVGGFLNKQAAGELGISEVTLQVHRSRVMKKMQARSLAELVRIASHLNIPVRDYAEPTGRT
jgi:FixJ family two-component response regulator